MDGRELRSDSGPSWNPFRCDGTSLPTGWLLAAKLLAFSFFPVNRFLSAGPPFLPFVPLLDAPVFASWLTPANAVVFHVAVFCLMCNRMVQRACLVIAGCILVHVAGHRLEYANNQLLTCVLLLVIGLYSPRTGLMPLRIQLALVYSGASLNKALDPDWWSGRYFDTLMIDALGIRWYAVLAASFPAFPERWLGVLFGSATIALEATIAAVVLLSSNGRAGMLLVLGFHVVMLFVTLGQLSVPFLYIFVALSAAFFEPSLRVPAAWIPRRLLRPIGGERLGTASPEILHAAPMIVTAAVWWLAALFIHFLPRILVRIG